MAEHPARNREVRSLDRPPDPPERAPGLLFNPASVPGSFLPKVQDFPQEIQPQPQKPAARAHSRPMPVTQADIDNLNRAIAAGVRSVTIGGQTVIYGTSESLIKARNDAQGQLNAANKAALRSRQSYALYAGRGYD